jgi:protein-S-isoprenylcysteine O-methyltransferase Ste14
VSPGKRLENPLNYRYTCGMRLAWPELIVLILIAALATFATEIWILMALKSAPGWLGVLYVLVAIVLDIWGGLRLIDWLWAGPARREKDIVKFSP